jgi:hypothetical protein
VKNSYRLVLASDVLDRDGLRLELLDQSGARIAEIFRDDENGSRRMTVFVQGPIPIDVVEWFVANSKDLL